MLVRDVNQLRRLKQDYQDGLVTVTAISEDTVQLAVQRYNERTGEIQNIRVEEVRASDITAGQAAVQELATLLGQLDTVVANALAAFGA